MLSNPATNPNAPFLPPLSNSGNKRLQNAAAAANYVNTNPVAANGNNYNGSLTTLNSYSNVPQAQANNYVNNKSVNTSNSSINEYQNIPANYTNSNNPNANRNFNPNGSPNYVNSNLQSINENDPYGIGPYPPNANPYVNVPNQPNNYNNYSNNNYSNNNYNNNNSRTNVNPSNISNYNRISPDQYRNQNFDPNAVNSNNRDYNSIVNLNSIAQPNREQQPGGAGDKSKEPNKAAVAANPNVNQGKPGPNTTNTFKPVTNAPKANNGAPAPDNKPAANTYANQANKNNKSNYNNISNINSLIKSPGKKNNNTSSSNNNNNNDSVIAFNTKVQPLKNNTPNKGRDFVQKNREQQGGGAGRSRDKADATNHRVDSHHSDIDSTDTLSPVTYGGSIGSDSVDKSKPKNPLTLSQRDRQLGIKPKKPSPAQNSQYGAELYSQYAQPAAANMPRYYGNVLPVAVPYYYPHPPPPALGYGGAFPYGFRTPQPMPPTVRAPKTNRSNNEKTRIMAPPIAVLPYYVPPEIQYVHAPPIVNDKDPSLHDLLYYDKFKSNEGSYVSKHIEKKIRNLDGFYHPFERHTLEDYRQLKANQGFKDSFGRSIIDYDPETKAEKIEKMQKRKEIGNLFSRSNPKPKKKLGEETTMKGAKSEGDILHSMSTKSIDHGPLKDSRTRAVEYSKSRLGRSYQDNIYDDLNPRSRGRYDPDEEAYLANAFLQSDLPTANYNADDNYQFDPTSNYYDD